MTDPIGSLDGSLDRPLGGDAEEPRGFEAADEMVPGDSLIRREDPARVAARASRERSRPESRSDVRPEGRAVPPQRRPEPEDYRGRVLPRREPEATDRVRGGMPDPGDRPRRSAPSETDDRLRRSGPIDTGERSRGAADTGDRVRDPGDRPRRADPRDTGDRPRGVADTGDRLRRSGPIDTGDWPRGVADTGDRPRGVRGAAAVSGRAVVADPARRPAPEPRPRAARPDGPSRAGRRVNPFEVPDPRGYSHATVASGQFVFLAGQTGADHEGRIVDGGLVPQFDRAIQNLLAALAASGGTCEHLTRVEIQVTSIDDYKAAARAIGSVWRARLSGAAPALSLAEVRRFWDQEALIQIAAQAVVP
ncbi:Rid family hydrolase [Cryptosporangium sp. NPDC051539]|uniref:Rid family hydrolase n=1 Tax=Cryptosporangium sp. NPDC051539 TaxID=3363962 RepID=UPI0037AF1612